MALCNAKFSVSLLMIEAFFGSWTFTPQFALTITEGVVIFLTYYPCIIRVMAFRFK